MSQAETTLGQRIGRRGCALLFFTLLDFVYALSLLTSPRPLSPLYAWMDTIAWLPLWAGCWALVGTVCLWYAPRQYDSPAFTAAVGLKVAWGINALFGWLAGQVPLGYVSAVIWLAFAAFVALIAGGIPPAHPRPVRWRPWTR